DRLGPVAWTDADGNYTFAHAPVGTYGVNAKRDGYLSKFAGPFDVSARRSVTGIDFVLADAPTIEGRAVDEHGAPLAGVEFGGWPAGGQGVSPVSATSSADGRFTIHLPQED